MEAPAVVDPGFAFAWSARDFEKHLAPEKLLRLHPHWHVGALTPVGDTWTVDLKNHETEVEFRLTFRLCFPEDDGTDERMRIEFETAPLDAMVFEVSRGNLVVRMENHRPPADPDHFQLELWLRGIFGYLGLYQKSTLWRRINRVIMNRFMIPMDPSQRKISIMIYRFTVLEVVVILLIVIGYFFFMR
ncbi:MAG: hypothetical protein JJV98_15595 [Desulfosarcina sp.]|nr:hypothetical protein [Desulfobacterales bacterium]